MYIQVLANIYVSTNFSMIVQTLISCYDLIVIFSTRLNFHIFSNWFPTRGLCNEINSILSRITFLLTRFVLITIENNAVLTCFAKVKAYLLHNPNSTVFDFFSFFFLCHVVVLFDNWNQFELLNWNSTPMWNDYIFKFLL